MFNAPGKFNMPVYRVTGRGPAKKLIQSVLMPAKEPFKQLFLGHSWKDKTNGDTTGVRMY